MVTEKMETGASKIVETGNKLARAGDYDEALECYTRALQTNPDDHGAMFNAGLIHEAKGELAAAEQYYSRAFAIKDREKYVLARARVRTECK
jgi:tetratricopeptide (TPR) repeat protein